MMDNRTMIVWLAGLATVACIGAAIAFASIANTKLKTEATVAKAQEHTKRAEGRHKLLDFLGAVKQ